MSDEIASTGKSAEERAVFRARWSWLDWFTNSMMVLLIGISVSFLFRYGGGKGVVNMLIGLMPAAACVYMGYRGWQWLEIRRDSGLRHVRTGVGPFTLSRKSYCIADVELVHVVHARIYGFAGATSKPSNHLCVVMKTLPFARQTRTLEVAGAMNLPHTELLVAARLLGA